MAELLPWRFLLFAAVCGLLLYLQFYLAHKRWRSLKGERAGEIDVNYVRREDYFAQSFRKKVEEWLRLPGEHHESQIAILKGTERIRVLSTDLEVGPEEDCNDILVANGNFRCGAGCTLSREVLVHGNADIGAGTALQAIATDGHLSLGEDVRAARWLDSQGELSMAAGCQAGARVTSRTRIRLAVGVRVNSISAPMIVTTGCEPQTFDEPAPPAGLPSIDLDDVSTQSFQSSALSGFDFARLMRLGEDTWLYAGDWLPPNPLRLLNKLVVKGDCSVPEGSVLEADVKATGNMFIGPSCCVRGNLVAEGEMSIGMRCRFFGLLHAERALLLSRGSRGGRPDRLIAAYAGDQLSVEEDVGVHGKLAAHAGVQVVDAAAAERRRSQRRVKRFTAAKESRTA